MKFTLLSFGHVTVNGSLVFGLSVVKFGANILRNEFIIYCAINRKINRKNYLNNSYELSMEED